MSQGQNPLEELSELFAVSADDAGCGADGLSYQLRFGETELVLEDGQVCAVSVRRAFLALDLAGVTIKPGSEYGAVVKPNVVTTKHEAEQSRLGTISANVKAALGVSGAGSVRGEISKKSTETTTYETTRTLVTPRGGQKWEIVEPSNQALDGTYLAHDVALCRLQAKRGANQKEVTARVYVKQRDLIFRYDQSGVVMFTRLSKNKERVLNILIAKALNAKAAAGGHLYTGSLVLSEAVSEHEG